MFALHYMMNETYIVVSPLFQRVGNVVRTANNLAQCLQGAGAFQRGKLIFAGAVQGSSERRCYRLIRFQRPSKPIVVSVQDIQLDPRQEANLVF